MNCLLLPSTAFVDKATSYSHNSDKGQRFEQAIITDTKQIQHIQSVLGAKVGESLKIAQQGGNLGIGVIDSITDTSVRLSDIVLDIPPPNKLDLTVILALPRPKVLRRLIMDMTALGVAHIILINSYRSEKSYWQSPLLSRIDEFVHEGLQKAGDTVAPTIEFKKRFKPFVEDELSQYLGEGLGVVAHPYAEQSFAELMRSSTGQSLPRSLPKLLCVGAEGGWIDYEVELLKEQGCIAVSMGERILRTEAAVNVLIGQWLIHQ